MREYAMKIHYLRPEEIAQLAADFADAAKHGYRVRVAWDEGLKVAVAGEVWSLPYGDDLPPDARDLRNTPRNPS
jgi:hypothetical protein